MMKNVEVQKQKSKKNKNDDYLINLGFTVKPQKSDLLPESFPSKIGGSPIWLIPPEDLDINYFDCTYCKKGLYFLLQLYCPLEDNKNSYHRVIYVFFCKDCWKKTNAIKTLRVQLPEISTYYNKNKLINPELFLNNEYINKINSKIKTLDPVFLIDSCEEHEKASRLYINFYDRIDEKSCKSKTSQNFEDDNSDEDELIPEINKKNNNVDTLIKNYYIEEGQQEKNIYDDLESELAEEMMTKMQNEIFKTVEDVIYDLFSKVVEYDPEQIVRYCRDDVYPLWFCRNGMLTIKNTKCKNCKGELVFEMQIMPNIFNIYKEIMNIDIGTIVIYTCKNSCNGKPFHIEESSFVQRTGEKLIDIGNHNVRNGNNSTNNLNTNNDIINDLQNISIDKNPQPNKVITEVDDEDGWVEIKTKSKSKK